MAGGTILLRTFERRKDLLEDAPLTAHQQRTTLHQLNKEKK